MHYIINKKNILQFLHFFSGQGLATILDLTITYVLIGKGMSIYIAKVWGRCAGLICAYIYHAYITFRQEDKQIPHISRGSLFFVGSLLALGGEELALFIINDYLSPLLSISLHILIMLILAKGVSFFINFFFQKGITFNTRNS